MGVLVRLVRLSENKGVEWGPRTFITRVVEGEGESEVGGEQSEGEKERMLKGHLVPVSPRWKKTVECQVLVSSSCLFYFYILS